jgi:hypothetical protein
MRFQTWQVLSLAAAGCILAGVIRVFIVNPTPFAFQVTIYFLLLIISPLLAYVGSSYFEGALKAFFIGGSIIGFAPWFVAFFWTMDALPRAFSQTGLEMPPPMPTNVAPPTLSAILIVPLMLGSPWIAFLLGGLTIMVLYVVLRFTRQLLVNWGILPATLSPRYLSELE